MEEITIAYYNPYAQQYTNPYTNIPNYIPSPAPAQTSSNGIPWVQGEAAAKSYNVAPGQSVLLMDTEKDCFYIKTVGLDGKPLPIRIFDYTERVAESVAKEAPQYVTKADVEEMLAALKPPEIDTSGLITKKEFEARMAYLAAMNGGMPTDG